MKNKKFNIFAVNFVAILVTFVLVALTLCTFFIQANFKNTTYCDYHEGIYYTLKFIPLTLVGIIILFAIFYILYNLSKKFKTKTYLIISLILITVFSLFWVNFVKAPVRADQKMVLGAAIAFKNGDYTLLKNGQYLYLHPLQLGIVFFVELLTNVLFIDSPIAIQNINIVFVLLCFYLLYKITKLLYKDEHTQKIVLILFPCFIVLPMLCVLVYGNIFGLTFALLSLFLLLKYYENRKFRYLLISSFSLIFSILLKNNYEIILIAFSISLVLDCIEKFDKRNIFIILLTLILFIVSNKIVVKYAEVRSGIPENSGIPMLTYIAMGLEQPVTRSAGWYHEDKNVESIYIENKYDANSTKADSIEIIKDRLNTFIHSPKTTIKFFADKVLSTWCEPSFQTIWSAMPAEEFDNCSTEYQNYIQNNKILLSIFNGKLHSIINYCLSIFEILIFAMASFSTIYGIRHKNINYQNFILILCFLGGFMFHFIWETKCIYVIPFFFLLLPSSANGLALIFNLIDNKLINKKLIDNK